MRKRNFKRIISLLLTVAMVFTMNTGVFADEPLSSDTVVTAETAKEPKAEAADPSTAAEGAGEETGAAAAAETETTGEEVTRTVTDGAAEGETKAAGEAENAAENESAEVSETQAAAEVQEEVAEVAAEETVSPDEVTETVSPDEAEATVSPDGAEETVSPDKAGKELSAQASVKSTNTVSGLTITYADGGASVDYESVSADNGSKIYTTINIKSGTVGVYGTAENTYNGKENIVSINIASGATMMAGAEINENGNKTLNHTGPQGVDSFTGDGTIIYSNYYAVNTMASTFGKGLSIGRFYGSYDSSEHSKFYYYECYIRANDKYYLLAGEDNSNKAIAVSSLISGEDSSIELVIGGYSYTSYSNGGKGQHEISGGLKVPENYATSKKIFEGKSETIKVLDEPSHTMVEIDNSKYTVSATTISGTSVAYDSYMLYTENGAPRIMYVYPQLSNVLGSTTINSGAIGGKGLYLHYLTDISLKKKLGIQYYESKYCDNAYKFTLSTNSSGIEEFEDDWTGNSNDWSYSGGAQLIVNEIIDGTSYENGKTYYLYGRVTQGTRDYIQYYHYEDDDEEWDDEYTSYESVIGYPSEPVVMGSFTVPAKDGKLTMTYNSSVKSYYAGELGDDVYMDKAKTILGVPSGYSIMNNGALTWSFSGTRAGSLKAEENGEAKPNKNTGVTTYTGYGDNVLKVVDSDGAVAGTVTTYFVLSQNGLSKNDIERYVDVQNKVEGADYDPEKYNGGYDYNSDEPYTLKPGTYFAYSRFDVIEQYGVYYDQIWSNPVEIKIEKAAINVQPDVQTKISGDKIDENDYLVTSKYTGVEINSCSLSDNAPVFDGKAYKEIGDIPALTAGSHTFAISENYVKSDNYYTLTSDGATYGAAQTFTVVGNDALTMEIALKEGQAFYYGNGSEKIALYDTSWDSDKAPYNGMVASNVLKQGGSIVTDYEYDPVYSAYEDEKLTKKLDTNMALAGLSANSTIYIQATAKVGVDEKAVSSNVLTVTVQPRPITIEGGDDDSIGSEREAAAIVSVNVASVNMVTNNDDYGQYHGDANLKKILKDGVETLPLKSSMLTAAQLDKNGKRYYIQLEDISSMLNDKTAGNFIIAGSKIIYYVSPVYYIRYVLQYGGTVQQSAILRLNTTSMNDLKKAGGDGGIWLASDVSGNGAGPFPEVTLNDGDKLVGWKIYRGTDFTPGDTINKNDVKNNEDKSGWFMNVNQINDDLYLHAVIKGAAGSDGNVNTLFVTSIDPVIYSGKPHVNATYYWTTGKKGKRDFKKDNDLGVATINFGDGAYNEDYYYYNDGIQVIDTSNTNGEDDGKYLREGVHYTISYKNNTNASVGFKNSIDATGGVIPLYSNDSKRPQVIIKGKGEYKGINVTVYYDIYPRRLDAGDENYFQGTASMKITGNNEKESDYPLFFYKKGKNIGYKFNVANSQTYDKKEDSWKLLKDGTRKLTNLKAGKDYEFVLQKKVDSTGTHKTAWDEDGQNNVAVWETISKKVNEKTKIKDEGTYRIWVTGINNYCGNLDNEYQYTFEVKQATSFSKLKFAFTKSLKWDAKLPLSDIEKMLKENYKLTVKSGKGKNATEVSMNDTGYSVTGLQIYNPNNLNDLKKVSDAWNYGFENAGKYRVTLAPTDAYKKANSVYGTKTIDVSLKGYALKASDFVLEDMKKLAYDGTTKMPGIKLKDNKKITAYDGYTGYISKLAGGDSIYVGNTGVNNYIAYGRDSEENRVVPDFGWYKYEWNENYGNAGYFFNESRYTYNAALNDGKGGWYWDPQNNWENTLTGPTRYKIYYEADNAEPGQYKVNIYAWGPFAESKKIELKYKRSPMSLKKAVEAGIVQIAQTPGVQGDGINDPNDYAYNNAEGIPQANINGTTTALFTVSVNEVKDGKTTLLGSSKIVGMNRNDNNKVVYTDDVYDSNGMAIGLGIGVSKFSGNNKATTAAKATFACDKTAPVYFTGTYTLPAFTIAPTYVDKDEVRSYESHQWYSYEKDSYFEAYAPENWKMETKYIPGQIYAEVKDVVSTNKTKEKAPKVTLYQASQDGKKIKKLKVKTDYLRADECTVLSDNKTRKSGFDISVSVNNAEATATDKGASTITFVSENSAGKYVNYTKTVKGSFYFHPQATEGVTFTRGIKVSPKDITFTMSTNGVSGNKWTFIGDKIGWGAQTVNSQYPTSLDVKINGTTVNYFVSANGDGDPISSNSVYIAMKGDKTPYKQQIEGTLKNTDKDYLVYDALWHSYDYDFRDDAKVGKKAKITVVINSDPTGTIPLIGSKTMTFEIVRPTNKGLTL